MKNDILKRAFRVDELRWDTDIIVLHCVRQSWLKHLKGKSWGRHEKLALKMPLLSRKVRLFHFEFIQFSFSVIHVSKYCNLGYELEVSAFSSVEVGV